VALKAILNRHSFSDIIDCLIQKFKGVFCFFLSARYSEDLHSVFLSGSFQEGEVGFYLLGVNIVLLTEEVFIQG